MTEENKELLKEAGISENDYDNCYISDKNQIFTPLKDKDDKILKTGQQVYEDYLIPLTPTLTLEERIAMLENLQLQQEGVI